MQRLAVTGGSLHELIQSATVSGPLLCARLGTYFSELTVQ